MGSASRDDRHLMHPVQIPLCLECFDREIDDPAHSAGTEMIMNDRKTHKSGGA